MLKADTAASGALHVSCCQSMLMISRHWRAVDADDLHACMHPVCRRLSCMQCTLSIVSALAAACGSPRKPWIVPTAEARKVQSLAEKRAVEAQELMLSGKRERKPSAKVAIS